MHKTHVDRQYALCLNRTTSLLIRSQPSLWNVVRIGVYTGPVYLLSVYFIYHKRADETQS